MYANGAGNMGAHISDREWSHLFRFGCCRPLGTRPPRVYIKVLRDLIIAVSNIKQKKTTTFAFLPFLSIDFNNKSGQYREIKTTVDRAPESISWILIICSRKSRTGRTSFINNNSISLWCCEKLSDAYGQSIKEQYRSIWAIGNWENSISVNL